MTVRLFDSVTDLSLPQNKQVVIIINFSEKLLRMADTHLNFLCKIVECFIY